MYLSGCMNTHTLLPFPLAYALSNTHNHRFPPCFFFYSFILSFVLKYFQMYIEVENPFTQRLHPRFNYLNVFYSKRLQSWNKLCIQYLRCLNLHQTRISPTQTFLTLTVREYRPVIVQNVPELVGLMFPSDWIQAPHLDCIVAVRLCNSHCI